MKKLCNLAICAALIANIAPLSIKANEDGGSIHVSDNGKTVTIGNRYIERTFEQEDGKWRTAEIDNKRIGEQFEPAAGSEDFVINLVDEEEEQKPEIVYPEKALERGEWKATLKNKNGVEFEHPEVLFDGDNNTYIDDYKKAGMPVSLEIDLGSKQQVSSFSFQKRPGFSDAAYGKNGSMGKFKLYVSENGKDWKAAGSGEFTQEDYNLHEENGLHNVGDPVYANFDATYQTQYVKIETLSDALGQTEEFSGAEINLYSDKVTTGLPQEQIDLTEKQVTFKGQQETKLTDGDVNFAVSGKVGDEIVIDLGAVQNVGSFAYQKRPGFTDQNYGKNGTMGKYELFVSKDGTAWEPAGKGEFTQEDYNLHSIVLDKDTTTSDSNGKPYPAGTTLYNVGDMVYGNLDQVYAARYVKIVPKTDCLGNTDEFQVAEIQLFADQKFEPEKKDTDIRASELTVSENGVSVKDNEVRVSFDTYEKDGINWDIDMVTVMEDEKHYMNSYLEITVDKPEEAKIDYIDFDSFVIPEGTKDVWSIPEESKISSQWIGKHELMLGQPIYADGLFFGSEFPAQDTDVNDDTNTMQMRYYSGKSIAKMKEDGQSVSEDGKTFRTWNNVVGAAQATATDAVQTDFFDYIEDIATPSDFRKQYNSWYDNMMNISDESIEKSFLGAEKGLAENGVEPLDSYVVDDGWNNYNNDIGGVNAPEASGTTKNQTGFWEFNSKFPNELYTSTELTDKFQSTFGVWVGPQGGYNYFGGFAKYLEAMGTGYVQSNSALGNVVCTGSRKYIKNFENRFVDYQTRFNIDYWKWDGFASRPCDNPNHDHMTGGDNNMYFTSDMWEGWTDLFDHARAAREKEGKGLWINATCYVNLSPWLLQWVNTIWVQDSGDTGQAGDTAAARHQQKIYYRDNVYYNLYKNNEIQFPLKNIYNHDPIYGVSDGSNATTEVFREFLFDNAMRGTAFWELYYSPTMIDDAKWKVTADALDFAESNHEVLKNAKLFVQEGKRPTNGVYGYSAWTKEKGFVSFVNPTAEKQTYTLTLDNLVGVPTGMSDLKETRIYPYASAPNDKTISYGDTLTVTLEPFSSQIYQYGIDDKEAPAMTSAKIKDKETIEVRFNERVSDQMKFEVNGASAEAKLLDDYRTFEIKASALADSADITISNISDIYGNKADAVSDTIRTAEDIAKASDKKDLDDSISQTQMENGKHLMNLKNKTYTLNEDGIGGDDDFSISMGVMTTDSDAVLLAQGEDYRLSIDKDGYAVFEVKGQSVSSKETVTTVTEHASGRFGTKEYQESKTQSTVIGKVNDGKLHSIHAVREANGMLKLYIDGSLSSSAYDEAVKNETLKGEAVVLGSEEFDGYVADVHIKNSAVYYDDAAAYAKEMDINVTERALDKSEWSAEACSQASDEVAAGTDGAAESVLDNDTSTYWHSNYTGGDSCADGVHTLKVDFGKEITFDNLEYIARPGAGNGTWQSAEVYGIRGDAEPVLLADVDEITLTDNAYVFSFDKPQTFDAVVFKVSGKGGYASAAEINATTNVQTQDSTPVLALQKEAKELLASVDEKEFTESSYQAFVQSVEDIMNMNVFAAEKEVSELREKLNSSYQALVKVEKVEKDELYALLQTYEGYKAEDYTEDSWKAFYEAYEHASDVYKDPKSEQKEVDAAVKKLKEAAEQLVKAEKEEDPQQPETSDEEKPQPEDPAVPDGNEPQPEQPTTPEDDKPQAEQPQQDASDTETVAPDKIEANDAAADDVKTGIHANAGVFAGAVVIAAAAIAGIWRKKRNKA